MGKSKDAYWDHGKVCQPPNARGNFATWTESGGRRRYSFLVVMETNGATGEIDRRLVKKAGRLDFVRMG